MSVITLNEMEFHAFHGCLSHEKELGNTFRVTLSISIDTARAGSTDNLADTLNYQKVYDVVKHEMDIASNLIEHVAQRIADAVMGQFAEIDEIKLLLSKKNPPLGGKVESVSIEIHKKRIL
ncbi:MAG: dihydroneopterin aldolase [Bacteroidetes bacterium]|nr:dihydroneopterin aldolase [Bacteroidota bacterium]